MKTRIIVASHNQDKIREFTEILRDPQILLLSMDEAGFHDEIEENGSTYAENAMIKAREVHRRLGGAVLADDSGLSVKSLNGYPGIYSARFAGVSSSYQNKIECLWDLMDKSGDPDRSAGFHCAIAYIDENGKESCFEAECRGEIIKQIRGENGFGYDPIFYIPELEKTTAELSIEDKNAISHRGQALRAWHRAFQANEGQDESI